MKRLLNLIVSINIFLPVISQPISLHPDNPHYFLFKNKPLAIVSSGEHYGAVLNPGFDYIKYLSALQGEGMIYTRLFAGTYFEKSGSFGIEKNTLAPAPGKALLPWKRSNEPGAVAGGNRFDLNEWDENYFSRLKSFISEASSRGIIVEITLFSSIYDYWDIQVWNPLNNINIKDKITKQNVQTLNNGSALKYQEQVVRKIVKELITFDNIFYEIQNEPWSDHTVFYEPNNEFINNADFKLDGHEWQKNIETADKESLEWQKKIASYITDEEKNLKYKHLIAQNYSNFYYPAKEIDPVVSVLNFHYAYPLTVELNYNHQKVIGFDESGFAGTDDATYRKQAWKFMVAGGGLFNNLDYSFATGEENGIAKNKAPGGGSTELRKELKILSDYLNSFDFIRMHPDNSIVKGSGEAYTRVLSEAGRQYAIYITRGTHCNLKLDLPAEVYMYEWMNPADGKVLDSQTFKHKGGEVMFSSPVYRDDIVLKIIKTK